jgi:hypothetical protein
MFRLPLGGSSTARECLAAKAQWMALLDRQGPSSRTWRNVPRNASHALASATLLSLPATHPETLPYASVAVAREEPG